MSAATEKIGAGTRCILAPTGNRVRILEEQTRRNEMMKKPPEKPKRVAARSPAKPAATAAVIMRCDVSADRSSDSSTSASSSGTGSIVKSAKTTSSRRKENGNGVVRAAEGVGALSLSPAVPLPVKRCDWITPTSGEFSVFLRVYFTIYAIHLFSLPFISTP